MKASLVGDKALMRLIKRMPSRVRRTVARKALRGPAAELSKAMKDAAPVDTEAYGIPPLMLRRSIGRRRKTYASGVVVEVVGPSSKQRLPNGQPVTRRVQFVERGTRDLPANPFLRRTAATKGPQVLRRMLDELTKAFREASK